MIQRRDGKIYGDAAARWLAENDPDPGPIHQRRPVVPPDWLESFEDTSTDPARQHRPCIYFVQAGDGGPVKIGYCSRDTKLPQRLRELQVGNPELLHLRRAVYGTTYIERQLHRHFSEFRLREDGEWFRPEGELATIARLP